MKRREFLEFGLAATLLAAADARAQVDWPSRPVRFVIPFPPGGGGDVVARAAADKTSEILKQAVVVENRTGGNAVIAATTVAQAAPDGVVIAAMVQARIDHRLEAPVGPSGFRQ